MTPAKVLALVGPTAAGKSRLAVETAPSLNAEIVSIDSAAIYRGMDIGTDKPSSEDLARVPHHMISTFLPDESVSVRTFQQLARAAIEDIHARGKTPLLVGGSGLYFRAVVDPLEFPATDPEVRARFESSDAEPEALHRILVSLDPEAAARIEPTNVRRTIRALEVIEITGRRFSAFRTGWDEYNSIYELRVAGLTWPRDELDERIDNRIDEQFARGLVDEVKELESQGFRSSITSVQALGYAQILDYLDGRASIDEARDAIKKRTRRFARRQLTWFKADPRVVWFEADEAGAVRYLSEAA